ncbi:MAG TPA: GTPase Era [Erysipelotrichaceae bacterium]|nr:GTPase Era [Erysipelotrichaceae bacterium]
MKSGFVAILGRPNVGKSTLMNRLVNHRVSIVTEKSQTTRNRIIGIYHSEEAQIVFLDTPGIHKPLRQLGQEMNNMAFSAAHNVEASLLVVDASQPFGRGDQYLIEHLNIHHTPLIIVFNKIDLARLDKTIELKKIYREYFKEAIFIDTVAKDGFNIDEIIKNLLDILPEGPAFYPKDMITDKDVVFQIKEIIREKILTQLRQEVPHSIAVYMESIDWEKKPIQIVASIIVEKESQKGIVIGSGGKRIKEIGAKARLDIEKLLGKHVFLDLEVKVNPDWRNKEAALQQYGYKYKSQK